MTLALDILIILSIAYACIGLYLFYKIANEELEVTLLRCQLEDLDVDVRYLENYLEFLDERCVGPTPTTLKQARTRVQGMLSERTSQT